MGPWNLLGVLMLRNIPGRRYIRTYLSAVFLIHVLATCPIEAGTLSSPKLDPDVVKEGFILDEPSTTTESIIHKTSAQEDDAKINNEPISILNIISRMKLRSRVPSFEEKGEEFEPSKPKDSCGPVFRARSPETIERQKFQMNVYHVTWC